MAKFPAQSAHAGPHGRLSVGARLAWWLWVLAAAVFLTCLQFTLTAPYRLESFARMAHLQAVEPFQRRLLLPAMVYAIDRLTPLAYHLGFALLEIVSWIALIALARAALLSFGVTRRDDLARLLALSITGPLTLAVIMPDLMVWPVFAQRDGGLDLARWGAHMLFYYPYDLPAAAFILALLLALRRWARQPPAPRHTLAVAGLFTLATVNRETTLFVLPMAIALLAGRVTRARLLRLLSLLGLLYVAVEAPLHWLLAGHANPHADFAGTAYELHVQENLGLLAHPLYALTEAVRFAGGTWPLVLFGWSDIEPRLRAAVCALALPLVLAALVVGRIAEHRIFIEIVPLFWLAALQGIGNRLAAAP